MQSDSDDDDDDEGGGGDDGRREVVSLRFIAAAKRARDRFNAERADPTAAVVAVYLKELFASPRHTVLPASLRGELLQTVVLHYIAHLQEWVDGGAIPLPPFVRLGKVRTFPKLKAGSSQPTAGSVAQQPSQRHKGDTPAVRLQPACVEGEKGTKPQTLARYKLYMEAVAHLDALLEQYDQDGKQACRHFASSCPPSPGRLHMAASTRPLPCVRPSTVTSTWPPPRGGLHVSTSTCHRAAVTQAMSRLTAELNFLISAVSVHHYRLETELDVQDPKRWAALFQKLLRSPLLHKQLVAATDRLEAVAKAINSRGPAEPFTEEHELLPLVDALREAEPEVATLVQVLWCRPPRTGEPLGRLNLSAPRFSVRGRAARKLLRPSTTASAASTASAANPANPANPAERANPANAANAASPANPADAVDASVEGPSPWVTPPASPYQLFLREEMARLRNAGGGVASSDHTAVSSAWAALGREQRSKYEARFQVDVEAGNARVARCRCAYICAAPNVDLASCDDCGAEGRSGHVGCFLRHMARHGSGLVCGASYLCPVCAQGRIVAARTEPVVEPSERLLQSIDLLVGGEMTMAQALLAVAREEGVGGRRHCCGAQGRALAAAPGVGRRPRDGGRRERTADDAWLRQRAWRAGGARLRRARAASGGA